MAPYSKFPIPTCRTKRVSMCSSSSSSSSDSDSDSGSYPESRLLLRQWLINVANKQQVPGVLWMNEECTLLKIPWTHGSRQGFDYNKDSCLFWMWAVHSKRYNEETDKADPKRWKANFRCAMNSLKDVKMDPELSNKKGVNAYKVYRFFKEMPRKSPTKAREGPKPAAKVARKEKMAERTKKLQHRIAEQKVRQYIGVRRISNSSPPTSNINNNIHSVMEEEQTFLQSNTVHNHSNDSNSSTNSSNSSNSTTNTRQQKRTVPKNCALLRSSSSFSHSKTVSANVTTLFPTPATSPVQSPASPSSPIMPSTGVADTMLGNTKSIPTFVQDYCEDYVLPFAAELSPEEENLYSQVFDENCRDIPEASFYEATSGEKVLLERSDCDEDAVATHTLCRLQDAMEDDMDVDYQGIEIVIPAEESDELHLTAACPNQILEHELAHDEL